MSWLSRLLRFEGEQASAAVSQRATEFIYVRIPGEIQPRDRHDSFEDPIDNALKSASLGYVSGGGTMQSAPGPDGSRRIELTGIDIEAEHLDDVRELLRQMLPELGAPAGTQIEFTVGSERRQDRLTAQGWMIGEPRTDLHPGFDL